MASTSASRRVNELQPDDGPGMAQARAQIDADLAHHELQKLLAARAANMEQAIHAVRARVLDAYADRMREAELRLSVARLRVDTLAVEQGIAQLGAMANKRLYEFTGEYRVGEPTRWSRTGRVAELEVRTALSRFSESEGRKGQRLPPLGTLFLRLLSADGKPSLNFIWLGGLQSKRWHGANWKGETDE